MRVKKMGFFSSEGSPTFMQRCVSVKKEETEWEKRGKIMIIKFTTNSYSKTHNILLYCYFTSLSILMLSSLLRLDEMDPAKPAACQMAVFTAGIGNGTTASSGNLCQRQSSTAGRRRCVNRILLSFSLNYSNITGVK